MKTFKSDISNNEFPVSDKISGKTIRHSILNQIQKEHPEFTENNNISRSEMNIYRIKSLTEYLEKEIGKLSDLEKNVLNSVASNSTISDKLDDEDNLNLTIGQKIADKVATFGGSWKFIISFGVFIALWININIFWLANSNFDPYPFILLNLILSCLAALQAPVIMMSQNRQEEKDRERGKKDYMINLKSELEIRTLHEKIDHFINFQQIELLELQKVQNEMILELINQTSKKSDY